MHDCFPLLWMRRRTTTTTILPVQVEWSALAAVLPRRSCRSLLQSLLEVVAAALVAALRSSQI